MLRQISPSLLAANFARLGADIDEVTQAGAQVLHLDVMDGHYVPNLTFGPMLVAAIRELTNLPLEAHLMISEPARYAEAFIKAGADLVLVHPETCPDLKTVLNAIRAQNAKAGVVYNPDQVPELDDMDLELIDQVLFMSVFPGFGGQRFMPEVLETIKEWEARLHAHDIVIEIDGGVNRSTIQSIVPSGVDRYVAGSAVFNQTASIQANFTELNQLLLEA